MFCKRCGTAIADGEIYCPKCGEICRRASGSFAGKVETMSVSNIPNPKRVELPTNRSWVKLVFLGLLTLGIYTQVIWDQIIQDLNYVARPYDGKRTMSYACMSVISPFTLFIYMFYWYHILSARLGSELRRREISYHFGPLYFWILNILLGWTIICPCIYLHMIAKSVNLINADYNKKGM